MVILLIMKAKILRGMVIQGPDRMACLVKDGGVGILPYELDGHSLNLELPLGAEGDVWR